LSKFGEKAEPIQEMHIIPNLLGLELEQEHNSRLLNQVFGKSLLLELQLLLCMAVLPLRH
jgi:hypothetical protein